MTLGSEAAQGVPGALAFPALPQSYPDQQPDRTFALYFFLSSPICMWLCDLHATGTASLTLSRLDESMRHVYPYPMKQHIR